MLTPKPGTRRFHSKLLAEFTLVERLKLPLMPMTRVALHLFRRKPSGADARALPNETATTGQSWKAEDRPERAARSVGGCDHCGTILDRCPPCLRPWPLICTQTQTQATTGVLSARAHGRVACSSARNPAGVTPSLRTGPPSPSPFAGPLVAPARRSTSGRRARGSRLARPRNGSGSLSRKRRRSRSGTCPFDTCVQLVKT